MSDRFSSFAARLLGSGLILLCAWAWPSMAAEPVVASGAAPKNPTPATLRIGISQSWGMPFASYEQGRINGGILLELAEEIATRLNARLVVDVTPPKRAESKLQSSQVDMHCLLSAEWLLSSYPKERWTVPLLRLDDVLLAPAGFAGPTLDLNVVPKGSAIGLVDSYLYPALDEVLASGRMRRENAPTQHQVFEKLQRGRSDFAVSNRLIVEWYNKQHPDSAPIKVLQTLATVETSCLLAAQPRLSPTLIKDAVHQMAREGVVQRIVQRYR